MLKGRKQYRGRRRAARKGRTRKPHGYKTHITRVRGTIVPDKMLVKLPYTDVQLINSASTSGTFQKTYSLSSIYDPEPGAVNSAPLGAAEYNTLYQSYRVYAASYEITLWNGSDDTSVAGSLYISNAGGTGVLSADTNGWLSQPRARSFDIGNKSGGRSMITLRGYVKLPGYAGLTSEQYRTSEETSGLISATSPVNQVRMFINLQNTNSGVTSAVIYGKVKIIYHTEVFDRVTFVSA